MVVVLYNVIVYLIDDCYCTSFLCTCYLFFNPLHMYMYVHPTPQTQQSVKGTHCRHRDLNPICPEMTFDPQSSVTPLKNVSINPKHEHNMNIHLQVYYPQYG